MQKTAFSRRKTNIAFSNCVVDDGVMYFYASNIRALCKMDMGTKEASFESDIIINGERVDDVLMVSADGDALCMLTPDGKYYVCYRLGNGEYHVSYIGGDRTSENELAWGEYGEAVYVFFTNPAVRKVIRIDRNSGAADEFHCDCWQEAPDTVYTNASRQYGEDVWLCPAAPLCLTRVSLKTGKSEHYHLPGLSQLCTGFAVSGDTMYLLGIKGKIFRWEIGSADVAELIDLDFWVREYVVIVVAGEDVYLLPGKGMDFLRVHEGKAEKISLVDDFAFGVFGPEKCRHYYEDADMCYFPQKYSNYSFTFDKKSGEFSCYQMRLPAALLRERDWILRESEEVTLTDYLRYLEAGEGVTENYEEIGNSIL